MRAIALLVAASVLVAGCAGLQESRPAGNPNLITADDLRDTSIGNMYELIDELRPSWLVARGPASFNSHAPILVYQGQTRLGGVDVLRQLAPRSFTSARYVDGRTASSTLPGIGSGHVAGAIVLSTRD